MNNPFNGRIAYRMTLLLSGLLAWQWSVAQTSNGYQVGFAKMSIEPPDSIFGLALGGYGAPAEGRFSTTWSVIEAPVSFNVLASSGDQIWARGVDQKWYQASALQNPAIWTPVPGISATTKGIAWIGKDRYQLDRLHRLWLVGRNDKPLLIKAPVLESVASIGNNIYGYDADGTIWQSNAKRDLNWTKIATEAGIRAIAAGEQELFFTDSIGRLWKMNPSNQITGQKMQIGRENGFTYTARIQQLAIAGKRLYALDQLGKLLVASHKTAGNLETGAMAIEHNRVKTIIVTVDVCGLNYSFTQRLKAVLNQRYGIAPEAILINSSHTHFAPVSQDWSTWAHFYQQPDSNYLNEVVGKAIIAAVSDAIKAMKPARIYWGRGETYIGLNRRPERANGEPVDRTLDVIKAVNDQGEIIGTLFMAGCHPVFKNKEHEAFTLSANFPAIARNILKEHTGNRNNLFIQGCGGDINPVSDNHRETGLALATDVLNILSGSMQEIKGPVTAFMDTVLIPVEPMSPEAVSQFQTENEALKSSVGVDKNIRWARLMVKKYQAGLVRKHLPQYVQTINIGNWKLVGLSREAVTSYGLEIRRLWPAKLVSVAGYCNDVSSYLPDRWQVEHRVYEGYDSFFWYGQEGIPPPEVQEMIIEKIKFHNR